MAPNALDRGPGRAPDAEARAWIDQRDGAFGPWIAGSLRPGADAAAIPSPASGAELTRLADASPADLADARAAAATAQPLWAALPGVERARKLYDWVEEIAAREACLTQLLALETGRPVRACRRGLSAGLDALRQAAGSLLAGAADRPGNVPLGVVVPGLSFGPSLGPSPDLSLGRIAPALAAGNAVILAPGPADGKLAMLCLAEAAGTAGLPAGLLAVLSGAAGKLSDLAQPPVAALRGPCLHLVLEDADLDAAADGIAGMLGDPPPGTAGHWLLVQESVAERVHARLAGRMARLIIGDPLDPATDLGPLSGPALRDRLTAALAETRGVTIQPLPRLPDRGAFMAPALITGLAPAMPEMATGLPGPVLLSMTFRTPAEAIRLANATPPAPAASLWSETLSTALDLATALEAGTVCVNGTELDPAQDPPELWQRPAGLAPARAVARPVAAAPVPSAALTAARRAQSGWAGRSTAERAAILTRAATRLAESAEATAARLTSAAAAAATASTGWAETPGRATLTRHRPLGVIAVLCPEICRQAAPMLTMASILGPVLAAGNGALLCPGAGANAEAEALIAALEAAGMPKGLVGIVSGPRAALACALAARVDLDALWCFGAGDLPEDLPARAAATGKALWLSEDGASETWTGPGGASDLFRIAAGRRQTLRLSWGA
ncbi:aldehyde dehydrogenase family protein [Rhodovulum sulfidophilum]|uniref:aldehyde dehydrogenase family protein n=1 Tax=Rhodovulum sulfidophilum TaxID=35806 RepID=UPI00138A39CE|nr:aldehyde dehydrogenase family protein [Rhodovulum sulfidophilum]NDK35292.1 aldehyde dehydrogenase family protein [Rhodovulum sulfidophilum]